MNSRDPICHERKVARHSARAATMMLHHNQVAKIISYLSFNGPNDRNNKYFKQLLIAADS
jgi:hypothetical protein